MIENTKRNASQRLMQARTLAFATHIKREAQTAAVLVSGKGHEYKAFWPLFGDTLKQVRRDSYRAASPTGGL